MPPTLGTLTLHRHGPEGGFDTLGVKGGSGIGVGTESVIEAGVGKLKSEIREIWEKQWEKLCSGVQCRTRVLIKKTFHEKKTHNESL